MAGLPAPDVSAPLMGAEMMRALAEPAERASNGRRLHYFLPHRLFLSVTFSVLYVTVYIAERKRKNASGITQEQVRTDALAVDGGALCASVCFALTSSSGLWNVGNILRRYQRHSAAHGPQCRKEIAASPRRSTDRRAPARDRGTRCTIIS